MTFEEGQQVRAPHLGHASFDTTSKLKLEGKRSLQIGHFAGKLRVVRSASLISMVLFACH